MRKKFLYLFVGLLTLTGLCSCDEHEPFDPDIHSGYILCSDGSIVADNVFDSRTQTPVAVVFAEQTAEHPVLAVLLDEIDFIAFADTLSFDQLITTISPRWVLWLSVRTGFHRVTMYPA